MITHIETYTGLNLCIGLDEEEFNFFQESKRFKLNKGFKDTYFSINTIFEKKGVTDARNYFGTIPKPI